MENIKVDSVSRAAQLVLAGLSKAYIRNYPYYVKDNFDLILEDEHDIFITDEEIIERVKHILSDDYELQIISVEREFISETSQNNFFYGDTELKLKRR